MPEKLLPETMARACDCSIALSSLLPAHPSNQLLDACFTTKTVVS